MRLKRVKEGDEIHVSRTNTNTEEWKGMKENRERTRTERGKWKIIVAEEEKER